MNDSSFWVHFTAAATAEIAHLTTQYGVPDDFVSHSLDIGERARIEREDGATLIVVRVPYFQGKTADIPYITIPLGIVLTSNHLATICRHPTEIISQLEAEPVGQDTCYRFVLRLLMATSAVYLAYLGKINLLIDATEDRLQVSTRNKELLELLKYQKCLVYFTTALKSNEAMMEKLQKSQWFALNDEDREFFEDVLIEHHQTVEMINIIENILSQMMDAFASIIANNLNVVMEFLAVVTILLALPTLVASFYGMNVALPFQDSPFAFHLTLAISLGLSLLAVLLFLKRRWL